jgi:hypothetical protein
VISNDFPFAFDDKAGTENVNLKMRSRAARIKLRHAFVVDQRFAGGIDGDLDGTARLLVEKFDDNVQQANARHIGRPKGRSWWVFAFESSVEVWQAIAHIVQRCGRFVGASVRRVLQLNCRASQQEFSRRLSGWPPETRAVPNRV